MARLEVGADGTAVCAVMRIQFEPSPLSKFQLSEHELQRRYGSSISSERSVAGDSSA